MNRSTHRVDERAVATFLAGKRFVLVGASTDPKHFSRAVMSALVAHGHEVVPVNRHADVIDDRHCYARVCDVPGTVDGVLVMTGPEAAKDVLHDCRTSGIRNVWLFKGVGGPGAVSAGATSFCADHDIALVDGACPLMFLTPVDSIHRFHRHVRRWRGDLVETGQP